MKRIIRKILMEDRRQMYLDKIVKIMKKDFPLYKNLKLYGFTEQLSSDEYNYVLSGIFGEPVRKKGIRIYNQNGNRIYSENSKGYWIKYEYDENGKRIYFEDSTGFWEKREYDENGNRIYTENSKGYWEKSEYDENGKLIYTENSSGYIGDYR